MTEFPKPQWPIINGMQVYEMPYETKVVQVKRHKKWRTDKKWRHRYGFMTIPVIEEKCFIIDVNYDVLFSGPQRKVVYATRGVIEMIKRQAKEGGSINNKVHSNVKTQSPFTFLPRA
jgi:hypothetical protein